MIAYRVGYCLMVLAFVGVASGYYVGLTTDAPSAVTAIRAFAVAALLAMVACWIRMKNTDG